MPFYQPIEKGAILPVRGTNRWAGSVSGSLSVVSKPTSDRSAAAVPTEFTTPTLMTLASSPVDSDLTSASSASSSEASDSDDGFSSDEDDVVLPPSPPVASSRVVSLPLPFDISPIHSNTSAGSRDSYFTGTFLDQVLPRSTAIRQAIPVNDTNAQWSLALLDEHDGDRRVLYAKGAALESINLRQNLVDLLDLADEQLECDQVVVVLDKTDDDLSHLLHSLLYVGGTIIAPNTDTVHGRPSSKYVLVGIDV